MTRVALVPSRAQTHAAHRGSGTCRQMLMGAGKTTVIAPMLALLLSSSSRLLVQVVPEPLLNQSQAVLRAAFDYIEKRVNTFVFRRMKKDDEKNGRGGDDDDDLLADLELDLFFDPHKASKEITDKEAGLKSARADQSVVCTTPNAVKSLFLSFLDLLQAAPPLHPAPSPPKPCINLIILNRSGLAPPSIRLCAVC